MHFILTAFVSSVLVGQSIASPAPTLLSRDAKRGFRAPALRREPKGSQNLNPRDTGAVATDYDGGWSIPVLIGGQQVILNVDTGSSDLWTASTLMPADQQSTITTGVLYDPTKSSTYEEIDGFTYSIGYADGSGSSGIVGNDSVNIGGATVPMMPFGVCNDIKYGSGSSGTRGTNGPVGLGFGMENSIRPTSQCTFMECLIPYVPDPIFSTKLTSDDSGFIDFGYSDPSAQTGDVTTVPIANTTDNVGQWTAQGVQFGSGGNVFSAGPVDMGFDLGNAALTMPSDAASAYFALVPGSSNSSGSWQYPCGASLPDLDYVFTTTTSGPGTVTVPGQNVASGSGSGMCGTRISTAENYLNAGTPFYISKYMIWNQALPSLSFSDQS